MPVKNVSFSPEYVSFASALKSADAAVDASVTELQDSIRLHVRAARKADTYENFSLSNWAAELSAAAVQATELLTYAESLKLV